MLADKKTQEKNRPGWREDIAHNCMRVQSPRMVRKITALSYHVGGGTTVLPVALRVHETTNCQFTRDASKHDFWWVFVSFVNEVCILGLQRHPLYVVHHNSKWQLSVYAIFLSIYVVHYENLYFTPHHTLALGYGGAQSVDFAAEIRENVAFVPVKF